MRNNRIALLAVSVMLALAMVSCAAAENSTGASSIREMVMTEKKAFSFRNGITWGMNPQQVAAIENVPMEQAFSSEWSILLTSSQVPVSRFSADLVYIFRQDALRMITYEFKNDCSTLNYQYLAGALCSLYGESREAGPAMIKGWMDRVYQNYYNQDLIHNAMEWTAEDGTAIYLYYVTEKTYAILYVCPNQGGGSSNYNTDGL